MLKRMSDHVDLDLPLHSRYASTVRAVTASMAADAGFSVDDIDDLRLGVNEAIAVLTDVDESIEHRLQVRFECDRGQITVRSQRLGGADPMTDDDLDVLARKILDAVVDGYDVDDAGVMTVTKRVDVAD